MLEPRPTPNHSPRPIAISDCVSWKPLLNGSSQGFEEAAIRRCKPVGARQREQRDAGCADAADQQEVAQPRAGDEEHGGAGDAEHDGGAEIGLDEQQHGGRHAAPRAA